MPSDKLQRQFDKNREDTERVKTIMNPNRENKVIVAGSRGITDSNPVLEAIRESPHSPFDGEIVTGGADGVDQTAKEYAEIFTHIDHTEFPADWDTHGKAAGPIRNTEMAEYADALIAVWDGHSNGTRDMIDTALDHGLDVYVKVVNDD